jgi:hypothetical protein
MIRLIIFGFLIYLVYRLFSGMFSGPQIGRRPADKPSQNNSGKMVKCETCGLYVPESEAVTRHTQGRTEYFCSKACENKKN